MSALDLSRLSQGRALRVRRVALGISQAGIAGWVGLLPERVGEAERESLHRSPRVLAEMQGQIDQVLRELEIEQGLVPA